MQTQQNIHAELEQNQLPRGFNWSAVFLRARPFLILFVGWSFSYQEWLRSGVSGFWRGTLTAVAVVGVVLLLFLAGSVLRHMAGCAPLVAAGVALVGGFVLIGSYSLWLDLVCAALGITVAGYAQAFYAKRSHPNWNRPDFKTWSHGDFQRYLGILVLSTWLSIWVVDVISQRRPISRRAGSIEGRYLVSVDSIQAAIAHWPTFPRARVGLALSGGGYRAALLHAGVLSMLDSLGIRTEVLSSVSGGSIIGAFYARGGRPSAFLQAMQDRRFHLRRELLHPPHLLWLLASLHIPGTRYTLFPIPNHTRTDVQAAMLDRLFLRGSIISEPAERTLMMCATDLYTGALVGITTAGLVVKPIDPPVRRFRLLATEQSSSPPRFIPWSTATAFAQNRTASIVAASGAFPGALTPLHTALTGKSDPSSAQTDSLYLADGGIGDNLGLVLLYTAGKMARGREAADELLNAWNVNVVIASDGSAIGSPRVPANTLGAVSTALDAVYRASGGGSLVGSDSLPTSVILSPSQLISQVQTAGSADAAPEGLVSFPMAMKREHRSGSVTRSSLSKSSEVSRNSFSYETLDAMDMRFIAARMVLTDAERATVRTAIAASDRRTDTSHLANRSPGEVLRDRSAKWQMHRLVQRELARRIKVFVNTSTLVDRIPKDDAESLYILGQYLVLLNKPFIRYALEHKN